MNVSADQLPFTLRPAAFVPFLVSSIVLAASYGSSFLLIDHFRASGLNVAMAGSVVSIGIFTTIVCSLLSGWMAERIGLMSIVIASALAIALAMLCFGLVFLDERIAYVGGLLLGAGWSVFYILAPLQLIHYLHPGARIKYLTLLSGSQMAGLGLASPLGHFVAKHTGSFTLVYLGFAVMCVAAAGGGAIVRSVMRGSPHLSMSAVGMTPALVGALLNSKAWVPFAMIGLGTCVFSGLSIYQSVYAQSRHLPSDVFFIVFTVTTVFLRFTLATVINRLPAGKLTFALFTATFVAIAMFVLNTGSIVLYAIATMIFAVGYGLTYSTLNAMAVNIAGSLNLSVPVASQTFTLVYFIGSFGFPYLGGELVKRGGIDQMLIFMLGIVMANIFLLRCMSTRRGTPSLESGHQ